MDVTGEPAAAVGGVIRPRRRVLGLRVVSGALLVTVAGVATFAAYAAADDAPTTVVLVARDDIAAGTRIIDDADARGRFAPRQIVAGQAVSGWVFEADEVEDLAGRHTAAPLAGGDLLVRGAVTDVVPSGTSLAVSLPRADALDGDVAPGDRVDLLATSGSGTDATTAYVRTGLQVREVRVSEGGLGSGTDLTLTVTVPTPDDAVAIAHAVRTAEPAITRSSDDALGDATHAGGAPDRVDGPRGVR